jgi:signal transduction histidine kinase/HAMP domain-containing protein
LLTLRQKLILSFAILILLTFAVSALSIYHFVRLGQVVDMILADSYNGIVAGEDMKDELQRIDAASAFYMAGEAARARRQFEGSTVAFSEKLNSATAGLNENGKKRIVEDIRADYKKYEQEVARFLQQPGSTDALTRQYFAVLVPQFSKVKGHIDELLQLNRQSMNAASDRARVKARSARNYSIAASAIALIMGLIFSWQFTRLVVAPIRLLARSAHYIAEGELDQRIEYRSHDEVGLLAAEFNRMSVRLRELRKSDVGQILIERRKSDAVLEGLFEPVVVTDSAGHVIKLNRAAKLALGEEAGASLAGTPLGERLLSAVKQAVEMQNQLSDEGETAILPLRVGDAERSYRLRTSALRDEAGRLTGAVTVLEDVTALREVDRFKNNFIQIATRKLQDPLKTLRLALYSMTHGHTEPLQPLQAKVIYDAEEYADQLDTLITDMLEMAEVDSGTRQLNPEAIRPVILARDAVARHAPAAESKRIKLEMKVYPDIAAVTADRRTMRSILDNLIANAVEFTPESGTVTVEAREKDNFVVFQVRDTGVGIAPERLPRIFSRFASQRSDGKGTGLGLALVRRLVEAQGGQVSAESKVGEGSIFSFTLPLAPAPPKRHLVEEG